MHRISRTSLAALVCPSAPFLAPRRLRAAAPGAVTSLQCSPPARWGTARFARQCQEASTRRASTGKGSPYTGGSRTKKRKPGATPHDQTRSLMAQFRQACDARSVPHLMDLYPTLLGTGAIGHYDTRRIAQSLHVRIRNTHADSQRADMFPFVQQIAVDLRRGALEPHPYAFVHLFGIYKECKRFDEGYELWQWLVDQDERFVSQAAYGAAIEFMAYGGLMSLPDLENLYTDGLKRFPGTFAEYHLSPDAIVPDRTQPTAIAGIPTILLQGILTARILARDWKRSYLALDTALRLYPAQVPARYFELFMTERPLSEAYTACMLACRAGVALRPTHLTALITKMRAAMAATPSMAERMMLVRAIANAVYAYVEAGGALESIHVGTFIRAFEQLLPETIAGEDYDVEVAELRNKIVVAAHEIISGLIQAGMPLQIQPLSALISLSGRLRVPSLLTTTLQDISTAGLDLGAVGTRSAITSAGLLGNKEMVEQMWERVVSVAERDSAQIPFEDWITFTKACRRTNNANYFRTQLLKLSHAITDSIERHLIQQIDQEETIPAQFEHFEYYTPDQLTLELEALKSQMKNIEVIVMSGQPLDIRQTPFHMHIDPAHPPLGLIDDLRAVYDERTTDPHQPPPAAIEGPPPGVVTSPTGIPLGELRFQNWVTVLEMMDNAEAYEADFQATLNAAIKAGKPLKGSPELLRLRKIEDAPLRSAAGVRLKVQGLRAANPSEVSVFRKMKSFVPKDKFKSMAHEKVEDKWTVRRIVKHKTLTHRERDAKRGDSGPSSLTYYVGMQSDHDAPATLKHKRGVGIRRLNLAPSNEADASPAEHTSSATPSEHTSPATPVEMPAPSLNTTSS